MVRNRHPAAIDYPPVCKECLAFFKSDCRHPFQLICKSCGPNMANVYCLYTEKFALEVAYRETRLPFWDALISRYWRPMTTQGFTPIVPIVPPWPRNKRSVVPQRGTTGNSPRSKIAATMSEMLEHRKQLDKERQEKRERSIWTISHLSLLPQMKALIERQKAELKYEPRVPSM